MKTSPIPSNDKKEELREQIKQFRSNRRSFGSLLTAQAIDFLVAFIEAYARRKADEARKRDWKRIDALEVQHTVKFGDVVRWSDLERIFKQSKEQL